MENEKNKWMKKADREAGFIKKFQDLHLKW
jgi:hypothetical protein